MNTSGDVIMGELYADDRHVATYNIGLNMTFFIHSDWLGTERARSEYNGTLYQTCSSGPFNESLTCQAAPGITNYTDPSTIHFTGKERDTESGLDYFGARYFASSMGRFMSPDWSAKVEPVPYSKLDNPQTLNLYSYTVNNPLSIVDTDGHELIVAADLQKTVDTLRQQSTSFNDELSHYEGANAPNLTIQFGATPNDPSGLATTGSTNVGLIPNISTIDTVYNPDTGKIDTVGDGTTYSLPSNPTTTITISNTIKGDADQVTGTTEHEVGHAHDARTNTDQYGHDSEKTKETNGKTPHDDRPEERRANDFKHTVQQQVKQYQKDHKHDNNN